MARDQAAASPSLLEMGKAPPDRLGVLQSYSVGASEQSAPPWGAPSPPCQASFTARQPPEPFPPPSPSPQPAHILSTLTLLTVAGFPLAAWGARKQSLCCLQSAPAVGSRPLGFQVRGRSCTTDLKLRLGFPTSGGLIQGEGGGRSPGRSRSAHR